MIDQENVISSTENPLVKHIRLLKRRKGRKEHGQFLIEGVRLIEEALAAGIRISQVIYRQNPSTQCKQLLRQLERLNVPCQAVTKALFHYLSDTATPQGIMAIVPKHKLPLDALKNLEYPLLLVADGVQDPGNLGSAIRTAAAAGAHAVTITPGTVDPYNEKVVRATMGAIFRIPLIEVSKVEQMLHTLKEQQIKIVVGHVGADRLYFTANLKGPVAIVIGNENQGPSEALLVAADLLVKIPLLGPTESLNASAAAAILLYEVVRQRCQNGIS